MKMPWYFGCKGFISANTSSFFGVICLLLRDVAIFSHLV